MANTLIKFKRGGGLYSDYITTSNFTTNYGTLHTSNGAFDRVEPWVNTTAKQLWVDAVCINPTLVSSDSSVTITGPSWNATTNRVEIDLAASVATPIYNLTFGSSSSNATADNESRIYDPDSAAQTLTFGAGLIFNGASGLVSVSPGAFTDIFLDNVEWVTAENSTSGTPDATHPYDSAHIGELAFTWNSSTPTGGTITYVDFGNYIDDYTGGTYITVTNNVINHNSTTRNDTTSIVTPDHSESFTVIDSVTTNSTGHVTAVNVKTVTLPSDNDHTTSVSTTDTGDGGLAVTSSTSGNNTNYDVHHKTITWPSSGSTDNLSFGGSFTVVDGLVQDNYGHILEMSTTEYTLPTPDAAVNTTYDLKGDATQYVAGWYLEGSDSSSDYVKLQHAAQSSGVGSMIEFNTQSKASNVTLTAKITIIDGGTFTNS